MSFYEVQFPPAISYGAAGGPTYDTEVVTFVSGLEQRNSNWSVARLRYDVSHSVKDQAAMDVLIAFFRSVRGKAHGFRFKDWSDFEVSLSNGLIGTGAATGLATYQLAKAYTQAGASTEIRDIRKPLVGGVSLKRGGATVNIGTSPGEAAIDYTTGTVTFVPDAEGAAAWMSVGATTDVEFYSDFGLTTGQQIYLSGFEGADAYLLNGKAHTILSISGFTQKMFTLETNTAGKAVYLGAGVGAKYPQGGETLTWSGEYDVPCRFDTDELKASIDFFNTYSWSGIPIVEIRV